MADSGRPRPHVAIRASNLEQMTHFVQHALELEPRGAGKGVARFGIGDLAVEIFSRSELRAEDDWGPNPLLPGLQVENLFRAITRLEAHGGRLLGEVRTRRWGMFVYFHDPEGNVWQTFQPQTFRQQEVDGVTYWIIEEPAERRTYVEQVLAARFIDRQSGSKPSVTGWRALDWTPIEVDVQRIQMPDSEHDPSGTRESQECIRSVQQDLRSGQAIQPLILGPEMQLLEGYARLLALRQTGKTQVAAYLGRG